MSKIITRLLPLLLVFFQFDPASAQQRNRSPNLNLGDAVVTGFSGTIAPDPSKPRPANKSAVDLTVINPDGPSARVIDVTKPGFVWDGRLFPAPKTFDVLAKDVGQVFGVALDDANPPNIYLSATSVFGLNIVRRGRNGAPERMKKGGPGAGWMKGQFGLDLQGGPGGIYKVDGRTGEVTLFANVTLDGVPNPGPALGNLAYDSDHKQLFVSDLFTGMIHRFALDGRELGQAYDHGVTGRPTHGNVPAQPFNARARPNIATAQFNSEDPDTWDYAPAARRVWALAVHEGRLYYSARNGAPKDGPQIWSVGIERDGNFAADPRWELDVPAQAGLLAISDIAFSHQGAMILAQRGTIAASYDYSAFTQSGEPRVLRFWLKDSKDPPSPSRWKPAPEEYAVGFAGEYRNTDGGVALGYGYNQDGTLGTGSCEAALWTTGQNLRNNPALKSQLEPGGPLVVHGLQASPADLVRNANTPPTTSYFVDYDGKFNDPAASGHIGSVRIFATPCAAQVATSRPAGGAAGSGGGGGGGGPPPPPPSACFCPAHQIPATGPNNYITNGNFATNSLAGWTQGGTYLLYPAIFVGWSIPIFPDPLFANSPVVPLAAGGPAYFYDDRAVNQSLSQSVILPAGNYEVGFDLLVPSNGAPNPNDATMSAVIAGVTVLPTVSASSIISAQTVGGVYHAAWKHYSAFFSTCGGTYTANFSFNSFGGLPSGGIKNAAKDFVVDRVYIIDSTTAGTNISCTGSLNIEKEVTTHGTLIPWPNPGPLFPMTLTCTAPPQSWSFSLNNNGTYTANNIPFGKTCTVAEGAMPPFPPGLCPRGSVPAWLPAPTITPASVVINGTTVTMVVHNSVTCVKADALVDVGIQKTGETTPACPVPYYDFIITATNGTNPWPGTGNIVVTDTVPANMTFGPISSPPWSCPLGIIPSGTTFTCTWMGPPPTANQALPVITIPATATTGPPFPPYVNCASVAIPSSSGYVDSNPANNNVCTSPVVKPASCGENGSLVLKKLVESHSPLAVPPMTFPVTVTCGGSVANLSLSSDGTPQTVSNIPLNTACTVQEGSFTTPPNVCPPNMNPAWTTTYTPPSPVTVTGPNTPETITNILDCERGGSVAATKTIDNRTQADVTGMTFPANVLCGGTPHTLTLTVPGPQVVHNVPVGTICSVTETQPPAPITGCPPGSVPTWMLPQYTPASTTVVAGSGATLGVLNILYCKPVSETPKPACDLRSTILKEKMCECRYEGMENTSPTMCMCKDGKLEPGKGCVPRIDCRPPLVPNATNTDCICPTGKELRRGKCVEVKIPKREIKCPRGQVRKNGECVKREKKSDEPRVKTRDVIRGIELIPGLGGRRGGGNSGGGKQDGGTPGRK